MFPSRTAAILHILAAVWCQVVIYEAGPKCGLVGLQEQLAPGIAVDVPLRFMMLLGVKTNLERDGVNMLG